MPPSGQRTIRSLQQKCEFRVYAFEPASRPVRLMNRPHCVRRWRTTLALVVFLPTAALAQSQDEQNACMNDAFQVCGHAIPDRDRVAACLSENFNRISMPCRQVMQR